MGDIAEFQRARIAIRIIKTTADALALRGYYKPSGRSGLTLEHGLRILSPEIYGTMNDSRIIELKGLEYVVDRLPRGIEKCTRITLSAKEEFENTSFQKIIPLKRRRLSYLLSETEICLIISRGLSEIYDTLTHLTFLNIEAKKINQQIRSLSGNITREWQDLEKIIESTTPLEGSRLDQAIWNLSIICGRNYQETRTTYQYLETIYGKDGNEDKVLFHIIYNLGKRIADESLSKDNEQLIYFTPSLRTMIEQHGYSSRWSQAIKDKIFSLNIQDRPIHIISANMHSVKNALYGFAMDPYPQCMKNAHQDPYCLVEEIRKNNEKVTDFANLHGFHEIIDSSGTQIDCQIIDTSEISAQHNNSFLKVDYQFIAEEKPVLIVMDYAFGIQAFELMNALLSPSEQENGSHNFNIKSISIMGKAGILPGEKGEIMLATAHVMEGTQHNYIVDNDLSSEDFDDTIKIYVGPIVTVLGTSLQNKDVLMRFQTTSWQAVGLEMEGGHYQRAINAAIIRGHISKDVKTRYAYYASDNPLHSGQTLASGSMGKEGIKPTYMITKVILEKILCSDV